MATISGSSNIVRPSTAQTARPGTARPATAASSRREGSHVVSVIEGRGVSREVGIAVLHKDTGSIVIVQVPSAVRAPIPCSPAVAR
jgi:DNA mismatch repair protein MSH4